MATRIRFGLEICPAVDGGFYVVSTESNHADSYPMAFAYAGSLSECLRYVEDKFKDYHRPKEQERR